MGGGETLLQRVTSGVSTISIASPQTGGYKVNFVYGGRAVRQALGLSVEEMAQAEQSAREEAGRLFDEQRQRLITGQIDADTLEESRLADLHKKFAANVNENDQLVTEEVRQLRAADVQKARTEFIETVADRGIVTGSLEGDKAEDFVRIMGGLGVDLPTAQEGLLFRQVGLEDDFVTAIPEVTRETTRAAEAAGVTINPAEERLNLISETLRQGEEEATFYSDLRKTTGRIKSNTGRNLRNQELLEKLGKAKPKIFMGMAAVAAISAGYYLAKRNRQDQMYDEVMEPHDTESGLGVMSIRDFNRLDQQVVAQRSVRRDPLATAGIVGNLDRNKTSHHKMGPRKYNNLYNT